jgi:hypothetical protein
MYDLLICNFVFSGVNELRNPGCKTQGVWAAITSVLPPFDVSNFRLLRPCTFAGLSKCICFMGSIYRFLLRYSHTRTGTRTYEYTVYLDKN